MTKLFLLDTNVLMHDPNALFAFEDNEVVIPLVVLDELDKHKSGSSQASTHARMAIRSLDELRALGNLSEGVKTEAGGHIRVEMNHRDEVPGDLDKTRADNRIISVALGIKKNADSNCKVVVITKDINLRVKCDGLGVLAEDYNTDSVIRNVDALYSGNTEVTVSSEDVDNFYKTGIADVKNILRPLYPNEYVLLRSNESPKHTALTKFNGTSLSKIKHFENVWGISSRNKEQAFALDALFDPDIKLVTLTGKAGSGKTLIAAVAGISQMLDSHIYKRMVLTRPVVSVGKDIGYLPGDANDKMKPWMAPLYDNLDLIFSDKGRFYLDSLSEEGRIGIEPITYIRGRSMPNSYIIVDEAQNLSKHEVKTIITRVGEGSKVVLTGDIEQIDTPYLDSFDNGLSNMIEKFKGHGVAAHITMVKGERSELATLASEIL